MENSMKRIVLVVLVGMFFSTPGYAAERVEVFVSIAPIQWLVEKVGQERVNSHSLVSTGQEPHTFEPTPKQIGRLSQAKIWFTTGLQFEHQLYSRIENINKTLKIVDITGSISKLPMNGEKYHDDQANAMEAEHGHQDEHQHADDDGEHGDVHHEKAHEHGEYDPHVWLSPPNLKIMADEIAKTLAAADKAAGDFYTKNAKALHEKLDAVHARITTLLQPYAGSSFFVYHPSFGYFADTYGLKQRAVEVDGKAPTPRQLKRLIEHARQKEMQVIFVQPQFDPKSADAIAQAIGGNVVPLNPLHGHVIENLMTMAENISSAMAKE